MARRAVEGALRALPWSFGAAAVLVAGVQVLGARLPVSFEATSAALLVAALALGPALLVAAWNAFASRVTDEGAALLLDRGHGLSERATAAVAFAQHADADLWSSRALAALGTREAAEAVAWRPVAWRGALLALIACAAAFLVPAWPAREAEAAGPPDPVTLAAARVLAAAAQAAEQALPEREPPDEARRLLDELRKAGERAQLEQTPREELVQELQRLDQQARAEQERRSALDAGALQRGLSSLEQALVKRDAMREAADGEAGSLAQQLAELATSFAQGVKFEERDAKRMAVRLREAAEALSETHPDLAAQLEQLAAAIERGDAAAAAQLAQELAKSPELQQLAAAAATEEALGEARSIVRQVLASLGQAVLDAELGQGGDGEGDREGESGRPGAGRGRGRGDRAAGQPKPDWGVGTTDEASAATDITRRGFQQDRNTSETSNWREAYRALHESTRLDGAKGRATLAHDDLGEGEITVVTSRQVSHGGEVAGFPVVQVPPSYARAFEDAMAREDIPPERREAVRRYFTSLDGPAGGAPPATGSTPAPPAAAPPERKP